MPAAWHGRGQRVHPCGRNGRHRPQPAVRWSAAGRYPSHHGVDPVEPAHAPGHHGLPDRSCAGRRRRGDAKRTAQSAGLRLHAGRVLRRVADLGHRNPHRLHAAPAGPLYAGAVRLPGRPGHGVPGHRPGHPIRQEPGKHHGDPHRHGTFAFHQRHTDAGHRLLPRASATAGLLADGQLLRPELAELRLASCAAGSLPSGADTVRTGEWS